MPVLRSYLADLASAPPPSRAGQAVTGVLDLDGVKLLLGARGWLLHRLSGTEPIIRIYAEHEDAAVVQRLLDETEAELRGRAG
jgi:phosphomannomutase